MNDSAPTLRHLLFTETDRDRTIELVAGDANLARAASVLVPGVAGAVRREIAERIEDLMDVDLRVVAASAWTKFREVAECCERSRKDPDSTALVALAEHRIRWQREPAVEVHAEGNLLASIVVALALEIVIEGAVLAIRGGRIARIDAGRAKLHARVSCLGAALLDRESPPFELPGSVALESPDAADEA